MSELHGHCLCGGVSVTGHGNPAHADACHCVMCRRQNGGGALHVTHFSEGVSASGDSLQWYKSSDYAERAFCQNCGTTIAWRMQDAGNDLSVSLGLFDEAPAKISSRIFVDEAEKYADIPQDVPHMTGVEAVAHFTKMMVEKSDKANKS